MPCIAHLITRFRVWTATNLFAKINSATESRLTPFSGESHRRPNPVTYLL
jgi:hypothetical protein